MNSNATLSLPMTAASSMGHASMAAARQAFALYARAPLASTGWIVLAIGGLIATSNALFGQQHVHPSPFFYQPRSEIVQPVPESVIPAPAPQVAERPSDEGDAASAPEHTARCPGASGGRSGNAATDHGASHHQYG